MCSLVSGRVGYVVPPLDIWQILSWWAHNALREDADRRRWLGLEGWLGWLSQASSAANTSPGGVATTEISLRSCDAASSIRTSSRNRLRQSTTNLWQKSERLRQHPRHP
jgi:hypothetical protein